jgi:hypothetical protein
MKNNVDLTFALTLSNSKMMVNVKFVQIGSGVKVVVDLVDLIVVVSTKSY